MMVLAAIIVGWSCAALVAVVSGNPLPIPRRTTERRSYSAGCDAWLQQAGARATVAQFAAASLATTMVAYGCLSTIAGPIVAVVPAAAIGALPYFFYARRRIARLTAAQRAWPDALRDVLTSIASGQSLHQAMVALPNGKHGELSTAFDRYRSLSRSLGTVAALEVVRAELADPVSDRVIEVFILAAERGGSVVRTILEDLAGSIGADISVLNEIDTAVLESRINARAVVALPWVALIMLNQGGGPFHEFYRTSAGFVVVALGAAMTVLGWTMVSKLSRMPEEQRVFLPGGPR